MFALCGPFNSKFAYCEFLVFCFEKIVFPIRPWARAAAAFSPIYACSVLCPSFQRRGNCFQSRVARVLFVPGLYEWLRTDTRAACIFASSTSSGEFDDQRLVRTSSSASKTEVTARAAHRHRVYIRSSRLQRTQRFAAEFTSGLESGQRAPRLLAASPPVLNLVDGFDPSRRCACIFHAQVRIKSSDACELWLPGA